MIVHSFNLALLAQVSAFDISANAERLRSVRELERLFMDLQPFLKATTFIEAGAMDATTSLKVRQILPEARIVAFEANPYNFDLFSKEHAHADHGVEYLHLAVATEAGETTFKIIANREGADFGRISGQNSLMARSNKSVEYEDVTVKTVSLDGFFQPAPADRYSLWVDVEGAAHMALLGADKVLRQAACVMIEVEDRSKWKGQWLTAQVTSHLMERGLVPVARDFQSQNQHNIVFVHQTVLNNYRIQRQIEGYFRRCKSGAAAA